MGEKRINQQKELVEEIGMYYDKEGFQPIAGRILGLLMVMDQELFTFDEIVQELQISKSSASNILRNLELKKLIEYVTLPGNRKRYFQLKKHDVFNLIEEFRIHLEETKNLLNRIIELKSDQNSENSKYYHSLLDVINFFLGKYQYLKNEYMLNNNRSTH